MAEVDSFVLVVIQDNEDVKFGALISEPPRVTGETFIGTGESFIFTFEPEFKVFGWTGINEYFLQGNIDSMCIGAGEKGFGIWIDQDLNQGRTQPCDTFHNPQLTVTEDFVVKCIECWAFL